MSIYLGNNKLSNFQQKRLNEYNQKNVKSIVEHSKKLNESSMSILYPKEILKAEKGGGLNRKNKGLLGNIVELYHFGKLPDGKSEPDFPNAGETGLELKTTGALNRLKSKEPLSLSKINIKDYSLEKFLKKVGLILIMVYDYKENTKAEDMIFFKFKLFSMKDDLSQSDYMIIEKDWKNIIELMKSGNTKKLRNSTEYLEAKTKGQKKTTKRGFYFKKTFLDTILFPNQNHKSVVNAKVLSKFSLPEFIKDKISKYFGRTVASLEEEFKVTASKHKDYIIINRILGLHEKEEALELKKANIQIKTVKVGAPRDEHMSFKQIKYDQIVKEEYWEDSEIYEQVTAKFMFVIYKHDKEKNQYLNDIVFYTLSEDELDECKKVWYHTKNKILDNDYDNFILNEVQNPRFKDRDRNKVAHIRTKDSLNKKTGKYAPVNTPQGIRDDIVRHSFWFNRDFIDSKISDQ